MTLCAANAARALFGGVMLAVIFGGNLEAAAERLILARASDSATVATDARLGGDNHRTRFILDLSRNIDFAAFTLADPYRVVIDLPQVTFKLPAKAGAGGRGVVKAFRYGLVMQGGSRIVIDTTGPVRVDKAFTLDPLDGQPARLVLDLVTVDRDSFMRALALDRATRHAAHSATPARQAQTIAPGDPRPLVVIDPGHGGLDTGTVAETGEHEKTIVLEFAQSLADKLEKSGRYRVAMTRTDDRFVPLRDRVAFARERQAALFISVHADALRSRDDDTRGATIYTLSENASDNEAARLAEAENRADVIAGVDLSAEAGDVADILIDLAQRETKTFSMQFAQQLVRELKNSARLHKNPLRSAGFRVLRAPDVPSVLVELGYVSSKGDLKLLTSEAWRSRVTDSLVRAVHTYFSTQIAVKSKRESTE